MMQVPPSVGHEVVAPPHLVEIAGDVEGEHHRLAGPVGVAIDHRHHGASPRLERAVRPVGLQLVVLHEVDAALGERLDQVGGAFRR